MCVVTLQFVVSDSRGGREGAVRLSGGTFLQTKVNISNTKTTSLLWSTNRASNMTGSHMKHGCVLFKLMIHRKLLH